MRAALGIQADLSVYYSAYTLYMYMTEGLIAGIPMWNLPRSFYFLSLAGGSCRAAAAALRLFLSRLLNFHSSEFRVNHDASAVFAHDNLLAHTYIKLSLGRNLVEASAAGITLHIYDSKSIA